MGLKGKPYTLFLLTSIILFIVGLFGFNAVIDIHMHDTYIVFPLTYFTWTASIILIILWLLYLLTKNILYSKALTWIHIIMTIAGCVFILILPYLFTNEYGSLGEMPRRYYDVGQSKTYIHIGKLTPASIVIAFILVAGQLTYLTNLVMGLAKRINP